MIITINYFYFFLISIFSFFIGFYFILKTIEVHDGGNSKFDFFLLFTKDPISKKINLIIKNIFTLNILSLLEEIISVLEFIFVRMSKFIIYISSILLIKYKK